MFSGRGTAFRRSRGSRGRVPTTKDHRHLMDAPFGCLDSPCRPASSSGCIVCTAEHGPTLSLVANDRRVSFMRFVAADLNERIMVGRESGSGRPKRSPVGAPLKIAPLPDSLAQATPGIVYAFCCGGLERADYGRQGARFGTAETFSGRGTACRAPTTIDDHRSHARDWASQRTRPTEHRENVGADHPSTPALYVQPRSVASHLRARPRTDIVFLACR